MHGEIPCVAHTMSDSNSDPDEQPGSDDDEESPSLLEQLTMTKMCVEIVVMLEKLLR